MDVHFPGTSEPGLDLVAHEQDVVSLTNLLTLGQVSVIRDENPATSPPSSALFLCSSPMDPHVRLTRLHPEWARRGTRRPRARTVPSTPRDPPGGCT